MSTKTKNTGYSPLKVGCIICDKDNPNVNRIHIQGLGEGGSVYTACPGACTEQFIMRYGGKVVE